MCEACKWYAIKYTHTHTHTTHTKRSVAIIHDNEAQFIYGYLLVQLLFDIAKAKNGIVNVFVWLCVPHTVWGYSKVNFPVLAQSQNQNQGNSGFSHSHFSTGKRAID